MKISTRFAVIGAVCALASLAIAAALVASSRRVAEEVGKNRVAADIVESVAGLRYLTLEYALQPQERVETQWASAYKSLGLVLARSSDFDSKEELASYALIRSAYDDSPKTFSELVRAQRARQTGEADREILDELVRRLTAAMVSRTLVMMTEALRLQDASREEVAAVQRSVLATVSALSFALVIVVAAGMLAAFRGIAAPLARLREGTRRVGAGDLEHVIGLTGKDEVAELAHEFDRMSAQLRTTTVSRDQLADSEERTRHILETALDAVVSIDSDGRITGWNPQAEEVFGWKREEVLGHLLAETIIPPAQRQAHRDGMRRYLTTGEGAVLNRRVELGALRRDGSEIPVELSITPIRSGGSVTFSAFLRDITERKQGEAKVQAQLARLDLLNQITRAIGERQDLQSIFQVVIRSLEDDAPIDFSCVCLHDSVAGALKVIGVGVKSAPLAMELAMPEQAWIPIDENGLSRCVRGELVYEPDVSEVPFAFPQRLAKGGLRSLVVAPLIVESIVFGVLVAARKAPHAFSSGECEFLRQLSEHVGLASHQAQLYGALQQAYDDLRQTQAAVMQQERLRALGQMASGIAHDINNAISPIILYTESLLEREPGLSVTARSALENIAHAIDDVAATVARMREFYRSREPALTLTPVDLNRLVQQVSELTRARWSDMPLQRGVTIQMRHELAPHLPAVMGVESEIREALINLVFNAVDAMPDGGELTLRTSVMSAQVPTDDRVQLEVVDTGLGMDEATRRRCLEPFFTTKGERGTGLGLAMVYGAVQRHGADIDIRSAVGKGASVALRFSMSSGAAMGEGTTAAEVDAKPPRLRILLVDDDPMLLRSLQETLEADGHVVATANSGQAGIDAFLGAQARDEVFAVVVTDLGMPYVDGRKVAAAIKRASSRTPVILLTGWGQRLLGDGDIPEHVDQVLSKPPKLRELRLALWRAVSTQAST
jgi:PAS domain S-box-containing protein